MVGNISPKASKKVSYEMPNFLFLVQKGCKFNALWEEVHPVHLSQLKCAKKLHLICIKDGIKYSNFDTLVLILLITKFVSNSTNFLNLDAKLTPNLR